MEGKKLEKIPILKCGKCGTVYIFDSISSGKPCPDLKCDGTLRKEMVDPKSLSEKQKGKGRDIKWPKNARPIFDQD